MADYIIPAFIVYIVIYGLFKRVNVYEAFIEGAKEGLLTAARIFPYLAAILVGVSVFKASGAFEFIGNIAKPVLRLLGMPAEALPLAIVRPFSSSAALSMLSELFGAAGPDSYPGMYASVLMGSTETIFYTTALYFGSVGVRRTRHTIPAALIACLAGIVMTSIVCTIFFAE